MGPLFYRKGVSLVLGLRRLIESSGGPDFVLDVSSTLRRLLGMLPANSPFCEFVSASYSVWLDVLTNGVDPLDFGAGDNAYDGSPHFSRVGSCCFVLYSFATDVLTVASSRVTVARPGSAVLSDSYAYVGPLSSLAGAVGPALPASSVGAAFVFGLVSYTIPVVLPVGLLSASSSGLGCVSLSLDPSSSVGSAGVSGIGSAGIGSAGVGVGGASGSSSGLSSRECIFLVLRRGDSGGDGDGGVRDIRAPHFPSLSYYTWSFVRSSLSRFYVSVGVGGRDSAGVGVGAGVNAGAGTRDGTDVVGVAEVAGIASSLSPPHSPLRFSDLSVRFSDTSSISDWSASEDEISSLIHSVRRAFD